MRRDVPLRGCAHTSRSGFALVAVLCVMVSIASLGLLASLVAREALATTRNRIALTRAAWQAEGCGARARAAADEALRGDLASTAASGRWAHLDLLVLRSPMLASSGCTVTLHSAGARIDVNAASGAQLRRALTEIGFRRPDADSIADAILDWRDVDDYQRSDGAERMWYGANSLRLPRNGPFADQDELRRVRGLEHLTPQLDSALVATFGVEAVRLDLTHAAATVIASLPGFSDEVVARVLDARQQGTGIPDLVTMIELLPRLARDSLSAHAAELAGLVSASPDAWIVTCHARDGQPSVHVIIELMLVNAGGRTAIVRRRTWEQ